MDGRSLFQKCVFAPLVLHPDGNDGSSSEDAEEVRITSSKVLRHHIEDLPV